MSDAIVGIRTDKKIRKTLTQSDVTLLTGKVVQVMTFLLF